MSQNDGIIKKLGLPILSKEEKDELRNKWQEQTWEDMTLSLNSYGKYIMLRPTGFGKTYTCACACNIGLDTNKCSKVISSNSTLKSIYKKKVIFVYVSEILKETFADYEYNGTIKNNSPSRIVYETYSMLGKHWSNKNYLMDVLDIENVGLVIFDEAQRMGALEISKALNKALPILDELHIPYIGATATVERATGYDVCDRYFTYLNNNNKLTYCWGEHIYTLEDSFRTGLLIPPEYQYIDEDKEAIKRARHTRLSMLQELKIEINNTDDLKEKQSKIGEIKQLERAVIKNADKIIHDTMLSLYMCKNDAENDTELKAVSKPKKLEIPENLSKYMRFIVFTPDRASMSEYVNTKKQIINDNNLSENEKQGIIFGGMVKQTADSFKNAFERYGYDIRITVISSLNAEEKNNINKITTREYTAEQVESGEVIAKRDGIIDLIFSINMLNVGYHVKDITGLIFKRWTGSNQIYYQQLGRCLSANSDKIPVVFDFVKSIDPRGINAPLFTVSDAKKNITKNADGTETLEYFKRGNKKVKKADNSLVLDSNGVPVDPKKCNTIDGKYITLSMTSASVYDIIQRENVYEQRKTSKMLFEHAYKIYKNSILICEKTLVSDISKSLSLKSALDIAIMEEYENVYDAYINFKAFIQYLKSKDKEVYVEYNCLNKYLDSIDMGIKQYSIAYEINSILAVAKSEDNSKGVNILMLVNKKDLKAFKNNSAVNSLLKDKKFDDVNNVITYGGK